MMKKLGESETFVKAFKGLCPDIMYQKGSLDNWFVVNMHSVSRMTQKMTFADIEEFPEFIT